jgi:hypothetical protein
MNHLRSKILGDGFTPALRHKTAILAACLVGLVLSGCQSMGPGTVPRDRADYSDALTESWKRQMLKNIVKLRYLDPPMFVDVGQIVSGYSLETGVSIGGQASAPQNNTLAFGASGKYTDRPTITYTPLTGNKFIKGLMTPLPPESVFFTIQSGWPADAVLFTSVAGINGLKNQATSINGITPPEPAFMQVLALMRRIQLSGAVAIRVKQDPQKQQTSLLTFRTENISTETLADIRELRRLLRLDPEASEFNLVFGATATNNKEVAVLTRSLTHQLATMASEVDVPAEDVRLGRAAPGWETAVTQTNLVRLIHIRCSKSQSDDAFVSVKYRSHWFWIDDRDLKSKRVFSFMMLLFTLADTGERENLPLITIPAQ